MQVNHQARAAAAELRRSRTRVRLIEAAMRVIAKKGPSGLSVSDIAAASGLSRGAFYNYFPQPDDLLEAVAGKIRQDLYQAGEQAIAAVEDPPEQLARACLTYLQMGLSDPVWGWVWLQLDLSSKAPARLLTEGFESLFRRGVEAGRFHPADPAAAAAVAFGGMRMAARVVLTSGEPPPNLAHEVVKIVLIGLGMSEPCAADVMARAGWPTGLESGAGNAN